MNPVSVSKVAIDPVTCTGCGLCVMSCPTDVIRFDEVLKKAFIAYGADCQVCYLCEDDCPTNSIALSHDISNSRRFSTYDQFGIEI
jgi:NAD-dependent dihydropyrimidine dehydrogenase PreA subunit